MDIGKQSDSTPTSKLPEDREQLPIPKTMKRKGTFRQITLVVIALIGVYIFYWFVNEVKIISTFKESVNEKLGSVWFFADTKVERTVSKKPNIIFILSDDLGFNDVGYHNPLVKTPVIDKLASEGVRLENYYVQPICSPTRSQLMSGRYQIHTGLQHGIIWPAQPYCLPLNEVTMAQKLKEAGYSTHVVGKWHLGFYRKECTPLYRGFDSFYGFLSGGEDYYHHNFKGGFPFGKEFGNMSGYDFRRNEEVAHDAEGQYSTLLFGKEAQSIVENHDTENPLYLYLAFQAVHSPLQVPAKYLEPYKHINHTGRRIFSAMTSCMDEAIGNLTDSLKQKGMWENTVLVFSTDNGGQVWTAGNNWPLRGWKWSFWEGGIRGIGFVSGPLIENPGRQSWDLMHVTDWFPTLVKLAGGNLNGTLPLDGVDQWETISTGKPTKRVEILHGIDPTEDWKYPVSSYKYCHQGIIRVGDWKLIVGCPGDGSWVVLPTAEVFENATDVFTDGASISEFEYLDPTQETVHATSKSQEIDAKLKKIQNKTLSTSEYKDLYAHKRVSASSKSEGVHSIKKRAARSLEVEENKPTQENLEKPAAPTPKLEDNVPTEPKVEKKLFLFNIKMDPEERNDMSESYPEKVAELMARLQAYNATSVPVLYPDPDPKADPALQDNVWGPWA